MATATKNKPGTETAVTEVVAFKPRKLWDMTPDLLALMQLIDEESGELSEANGKALEKWMNELGSEIGTKLDGYVHAIRNFDTAASVHEATAKQYAAEAALFANRAKVNANAAQRLKDRLRDWMTLTEQTKIETASGRKLSVRANGGKDYLDMDTVSQDDAELKPFFVTETITRINADAVVKAMAEGKKFARAGLKPKGSHLRID